MKVEKLDTKKIMCRNCWEKPATWDIILEHHCCLCDDCIKELSEITQLIVELKGENNERV